MPQLESVALHCVHCGGAVTLICERQQYPPDQPHFVTWACPYSECGKENFLANIRIVSAWPRNYEAPERKQSAS